MPRSPASRLARKNSRPCPILPKRSADAKTPIRELTWNEKEALLEKFDEWCKTMKAQGVKEPSVRLFERQFATRGQVSRLLKQREKLKGLQVAMPEDAAD
ncbi:hypothetical protein BGZ65_005872, partial [Modicella reniformis]